MVVGAPLPEEQTDEHDCLWHSVTFCAHVSQLVSGCGHAVWQAVSPEAHAQKHPK
jgi:hypothetical protein